LRIIYKKEKAMAQSGISLRLSDYGISKTRGFLPDIDPIEWVTYSEVFSPLQAMANQLPKLLAAGALRSTLDTFSQKILIPLADRAFDMTHSYVHSEITHYTRGFLERVKVIFDYLAQAYVWGEQPVAAGLPAGFAKFFYHVSDLSGLPPILTYTPYALWNWKRIDPTKPIEIGNLAIVQNFLGGLDEDWFVLIHIDIEHRAGTIPLCIAKAMEAVSSSDAHTLKHHLALITISLKRMFETLNRMTEKCNPYIYYTRVRPYLHGSMNNPALPDGLLYPGVQAYQETPQKFRGESGAQSAIVPSLIAALNIRHTENEFTPYLREIRGYMPNGYRRFIQTIEHLNCNRNSILDFVVAHKESHPDLYDTYRNCRQALHAFRQKHYQYVDMYIHSQAQQGAGNPTEVGTAGTPFMRSLKQLMDETWFE